METSRGIGRERVGKMAQYHTSREESQSQQNKQQQQAHGGGGIKIVLYRTQRQKNQKGRERRKKVGVGNDHITCDHHIPPGPKLWGVLKEKHRGMLT